ncbi:MAG: hypothetical protein ACK5OW_00185 [bacterium]|jgi:hypothetical protein
MIKWTGIRDRWIEGDYKTIKLYLHLTKEQKVDGLYFIEGNHKEKVVPEDEVEMDIDFMKLMAEQIIKEKYTNKYGN